MAKIVIIRIGSKKKREVYRLPKNSLALFLFLLPAVIWVLEPHPVDDEVTVVGMFSSNRLLSSAGPDSSCVA